MKKYIIIFCFLLTLPSLYSQQEAMFTHYMYNALSVNPAYAGSRESLSMALLHRSQWIGFDGAPVTQTVTVHSPVYNNSVNMGFSIIHDQIGPVNNSAAFVDYAFRIRLTSKSVLAFGIKAGFNNYHFNLSELTASDISDAAVNLKNSSFLPNTGFGAYYSCRNLYAGISVPRLFQNTYFYTNSDGLENLSLEKRHYYIIFGGIVPVSNILKLKPTALLKLTEGAPFQGDFTFRFLFLDKYSLGAMYRTGESAGVLAGFYLSEQLNIGYSFDWSFENTTSKYNSGSHEIVLQYDFIFNSKKKIRSPRYFCTF